jgi:hypothetical protein
MAHPDWSALEAQLTAALRDRKDLIGYRLTFTTEATENMAYGLAIEDANGEDALSFDGADPADVIRQALAALPRYQQP